MGVATWILTRRRKVSVSDGPVSLDDLLNPELRERHVQWNHRLHASASGLLPVAGATNSFVAIGHNLVQLLSQDERLTSNPFEDRRLLALNTMGKERHAAVAKVVQRYYQHREMRRLEPAFWATVKHFADGAVQNGSFDVMPWARRVHMANTLKVLLGDAAAANMHLVDDLVQFNDDMVRLVAPLGGVGRPCPALFSWNTVRLLRALLASVPALLALLARTGLSGLAIVRPDKTLSRSALGSGVWHHPELLPQVPRYFGLLMDLWAATPLREAPSSPLEALRAAVGRGDVSLHEALVTVVQLMVNMTSANALGNLVMRLCSEPRPDATLENEDAALEEFVGEVLRLDAPLQRNPRRALDDLTIAGVSVPRGSQLLLFIGAANVDPKAFAKPEAFKPGRLGQPLTFGAGPHYCLGAYLVKAEMREALRFLLGRFTSFRLEACERVRNVDVGNYGFESLRVAVS